MLSLISTIESKINQGVVATVQTSPCYQQLQQDLSKCYKLASIGHVEAGEWKYGEKTRQLYWDQCPSMIM